jgi:hypothetical protein
MRRDLLIARERNAHEAMKATLRTLAERFGVEAEGFDRPGAKDRAMRHLYEREAMVMALEAVAEATKPQPAAKPRKAA